MAYEIERTVFAVVPSTEMLHLLLEDGQLPHHHWHNGEGTLEQTLSVIGHRVLGHALSPDMAYNRPGGTIYLAKPVDKLVAAPTRANVEWRGLELGATSQHGLREYWKNYIRDAIRSLDRK